MTFKQFSVTLTLLLFAKFANAQQIIPIYNSKNLENNTLTIYSDSGNLAITAYKANVVRISFLNHKADTLKPVNKLNIRVTQNLDDIFFATDSLWVVVSKFDLSIKFLRKKDERLLAKNTSYFVHNDKHTITFSLNKDDNPIFFEAKTPDKIKTLSKGKKKLCSPMILSPKGYALAVKNATEKKTRISFSAKANRQIKFEAEKPYLQTFYFLSGDTDEIKKNLELLKDIISCFKH